MSKDSWPKFSFTELLKPPDGWKTDHAVLCTYSADLVVIITSLLALSGCDLESRRTGTRVELVRAIEALRGRVRILGQSGRLVRPSGQMQILKLLDRFIKTVKMNENENSFHPKAALMRYQNADEPDDFQWRIWFGSRNLTRAMNWEAGAVLVSRRDGKGQKVDGLAAAAEGFIARARLTGLSAKAAKTELEKLTWECPPGCTLSRVSVLGPDAPGHFPDVPANTERVFVVSPFLDAATVRKAARWGGPKTRRTIVSTDMEFQRLLRQNDRVFEGFEHLCRQPLPDLPGEELESIEEESSSGSELAESEEAPPQGLHAKLLFAAKGNRRQLWIGSANATGRGWGGRNVEVVAELSVSQEVADGLGGFVDACDRFTPGTAELKEDEIEEALEKARKALSGEWSLTQIVKEGALEIVASSPPPIENPEITVDVAAMGCPWQPWPSNTLSVHVANIKEWERTDFVQVRVRLGQMAFSWLQIAPCDPPPDETRDHRVIAQYLDPNTFLWWLRSLLAERPIEDGGGDWDSGRETPNGSSKNGAQPSLLAAVPTVEEIMRAWARNADAFRNADGKVKTYLAELERRAAEQHADSDVELLEKFRKTWNTLSEGLK
jgi:hypothetical protein